MMKSAGSRAAPTFSYLLVVLLAAQALGTMATSTLPAVVPKVAETYGVSSALIGYQISLLAIAMLVSLTFGGNLSVRWGACRVTQVGIACLIAGSLTAIIPHVAFIFASAIGALRGRDEAWTDTGGVHPSCLAARRRFWARILGLALRPHAIVQCRDGSACGCHVGCRAGVRSHHPGLAYRAVVRIVFHFRIDGERLERRLSGRGGAAYTS
jgi:hypothetical protein